MSVVQLAQLNYIGLSTDVKPTTGVVIGAKFFETDHDHIQIWDGSVWTEIEQTVLQDVSSQIRIGAMWEISDISLAISDDANYDIIITVGSIQLHTVHGISVEGKAEVRIYQAPTFSGGNAITVFNALRSIGTTGAPTAVKAATVTDVGTLMFQHLIAGGTGGKASGGIGARESEEVLTANTSYLYRVKNTKGNASDMSWQFFGFEHN